MCNGYLHMWFDFQQKKNCGKLKGSLPLFLYCVSLSSIYYAMQQQNSDSTCVLDNIHGSFPTSTGSRLQARRRENNKTERKMRITKRITICYMNNKKTHKYEENWHKPFHFEEDFAPASLWNLCLLDLCL